MLICFISYLKTCDLGESTVNHRTQSTRSGQRDLVELCHLSDTVQIFNKPRDVMQHLGHFAPATGVSTSSFELCFPNN